MSLRRTRPKFNVFFDNVQSIIGLFNTFARNVAAMLEKARKLYENNQIDDALLLYNEFLDEHPNHAEALFFRALIFRKLNKHSESLEDLNNIIDRLPDQASILFERGITYAYLGEQEKSLADLNSAVALEPENAFRYAGRAYIKAMFKMYKEAAEDYKKALEIDPDDEISLNNLGLVQEQLGYWEQAQQSFDQADDVYNRKNPDKQLPKRENNQKSEEQNSVEEPFTPTSKDYFNLIKNVFKHKAYFNDYLNFLKQLLSGKR